MDNVENGKNDDYDNYKFVLNDGMRDYFELDDQENEIQIPVADSRDVPRIDENITTVSSNDLAFQDSSRTFLTLPAQLTHVEIPLVS